MSPFLRRRNHDRLEQPSQAQTQLLAKKELLSTQIVRLDTTRVSLLESVHNWHNSGKPASIALGGLRLTLHRLKSDVGGVLILPKSDTLERVNFDMDLEASRLDIAAHYDGEQHAAYKFMRPKDEVPYLLRGDQKFPLTSDVAERGLQTAEELCVYLGHLSLQVSS